MNEPKPILRYKWEYSNFLEYIQDKKIERALIYAKTLGITLTIIYFNVGFFLFYLLREPRFEQNLYNF